MNLKKLLSPRVRDEAPAPQACSVPEGMRVYAIGDIHGRYDLLCRMLDMIEEDRRGGPDNVRTVFLGDLIDRGPESRQVIERLIAGKENEGWTCLMGNHEAMLLAALDGKGDWRRWLGTGGVEALMSYGMDALELGRLGKKLGDAVRKALPHEHVTFLRELESHAVFGDYFFCHAGIRPGVPLDAQLPRDLVWIREQFLNSRADHGKRIVHGHTPRAKVEQLPNRINLDTGAYYSGRLSCAVIEGDQVRILQT